MNSSLLMVENLGFTNRIDKEEIEIKEKIQVLSQVLGNNSILQLRLSFTSTPPIHKPSSFPTPKGGHHHE